MDKVNTLFGLLRGQGGAELLEEEQTDSNLQDKEEAEVPSEELEEEELNERTVKVVRDGKVTKKEVCSVKKKLTSAQKAALAKARKKAHTSSANKERVKSMKVRNRKLNDEEGLDPITEELLNEAESLTIDASVKNKLLQLIINGSTYTYSSEDYTAEELLSKFKSIAKHNKGTALKWIKKNTKLESGSKKKSKCMNEEELYRCPECGYEGNLKSYEEKDGYICPECGVELELSESEEEPDGEELLEEKLEELEAPAAMFTALAAGRISMVQTYIKAKEGK